MSDAEAYLRRGKKIQSERFGRAGVARGEGSTSDSGDPEKPAGAAGVQSVVIVSLHDTQRNTQLLPMKKKKKNKRSRSDSDSDDDHTNHSSDNHTREDAGSAASTAEATVTTTERDVLGLASVASPSSPVPPVEGVAQRISLLSKWFPASLQEGKLDSAVAPAADFVESTVDRMNKARDYVLALRYGIEDVEMLLKSSRDSFSALWMEQKGGKDDESVEDARKRFYWELRGKQIAKLVRASGVTEFKAAVSEFADEVPSTAAGVAAAVCAVARRRRGVRMPLEYSLKGWHEVLDSRGPEAGFVPRLSDILWLSVASATAMFTVLTQRLLHRARALSERRLGSGVTTVQDTQETGDGASDTEAEGPRFFDNTVDEEEEEAEDSDAPPTESTTGDWIAQSSAELSSSLSTDEKALLAFLRFLMPFSEVESSTGCRRSAGVGVWLYAAFTTLDTPLDPDTARLAHDLFRTCCRHLRTLATWKGVSGGTRDSLLRSFAPRSKGQRVAYEAMKEVSREDVLALYTVVVVLARFFRQNQDHFIPL
uniref:Uncharacterized protein n=1 Tax=Angomonas deanei TaxID=59799 RepID=C6K3P5_9TRYP|nr:hypothetical protein CDFL6B12_07 [Angomonas deanei]